MSQFADPSIVEPKLAEKIWAKFFADNPHLSRGETMQAPVGMGLNGKIVKDVDVNDPSDYVLTARTFKVTCGPLKPVDGKAAIESLDKVTSLLPNMEVGSYRGYVYPYMIRSAVVMTLKFEPVICFYLRMAFTGGTPKEEPVSVEPHYGPLAT